MVRHVNRSAGLALRQPAQYRETAMGRLHQLVIEWQPHVLGTAFRLFLAVQIVGSLAAGQTSMTVPDGLRKHIARLCTDAGSCSWSPVNSHAWEEGSAERPKTGRYDNFGPYTVDVGEDASRVVTGLRSFLWTHWHERRRGYAVVTRFTLAEGRACKVSYSVEPVGKAGVWHIKLSSEIRGKGYHRAETFTGVSVARIATDHEGRETGGKIPDEANCLPDSYILVLKDKRGKTYPRL
jgi:hypothetical protein